MSILLILILCTTLLGAVQNKSRKNVVFFHATWCGPCNQMKRNVLPHPSIKKILKQYFFGKERPVMVDIDKYPDLARKYGVSSIPVTMIVNDQDKVEKRRVGYMSVSQFKRFIE